LLDSLLQEIFDMGVTHRNSNLSITQRRAQLLADIKRGKGNDLAFIPENYVSISEVTRKFNLSDDDLLPLKGAAVVATRYGQEGVFYPLEEIESLNSSKINTVTADMIPENLIRRQLPRDSKFPGMFEKLRPFSSTWELPNHVGRREGHKGRPTYYYTQDVLKRELGLEVITKEMVEGIDYLEMTSVLIEVRAELSYPPLAINVGVPSDRARRCYFREQVEYIGTRWNKKLTRKSTRCAAVQKSLNSNTDQQDLSLETTTDYQQDHSPDLTSDQMSLSQVSRADQQGLGLETTNDLLGYQYGCVCGLQDYQSCSGGQGYRLDGQGSYGSSGSGSSLICSGCQEYQISSGERSLQSCLSSGPQGSQSSPGVSVLHSPGFGVLQSSSQCSSRKQSPP